MMGRPGKREASWHGGEGLYGAGFRDEKSSVVCRDRGAAGDVGRHRRRMFGEFPTSDLGQEVAGVDHDHLQAGRGTGRLGLEPAKCSVL
jgi:hypothetical protein